MILADLLQDQNPWWRDGAIRRARGYPVRRELQPKILDRILRVDDRPIAAVTFPDPYPFYAELVARVAAAPSVAYRPSANVRIPGRPAP